MAKPTGSFTVGYTDFTYLDPSSETTGLDVDPSKHLVGCIFYPAEKNVDTGKFPAVRWIPAYGYAYGFARFTQGMVSYAKKSWWGKIQSRVLTGIIAQFSYLLGSSTKLPAYRGMPINTEHASLPVVVIVHGVGGNRVVHSCTACELASQGFVVVALDCGDGTASAAHILTSSGLQWKYFNTVTATDHSVRMLSRLEEMRTIARVFTAINKGKTLPGFSLTDALEGFSLQGRLDMGCVASIGHSFGGSPACATTAEANSIYKAGIGLDAHWPPLPREHPVFTGFQSPASLLLIGSQTWNDPSEKSFLKSDKTLEKQVTSAARLESGGGGLISVVMTGTGHASFTDADLLFQGWTPKFALKALPKDARRPTEIIANMNEMILTFLKAHLPLTEQQAALINPKGPRSQLASAQADSSLQQDTSAVTQKVGEAEAEIGSQAAAGLESAIEAGTAASAPGKAGQFSGGVGAGSGSEGSQTRRGKPVAGNEEATYREILGDAGSMALSVAH